VDALGDGGEHALTLIVFVGSVFSPFYARARARDSGADPMEHCAINVAVYGRTSAWAFTERPRREVARAPDALSIGRSRLEIGTREIVLYVDERCAPFGRRLKGTVRFRSLGGGGAPVALDSRQRHRWWPVAPFGRVEVVFDEPALRFSGSGYHDVNEGDEPLERAFSRWSWSRADDGARALVLYDVEGLDGTKRELALAFDPERGVETFEAPRRLALGATRWGVPRTTRTERGGRARAVRTLEDTPFYARTEIETRLEGRELRAIHESLDLRRFSAEWVRFLLPFRMRWGLRA
jgi:carotenoid 1,2-hydratase